MVKDNDEKITVMCGAVQHKMTAKQLDFCQRYTPMGHDTPNRGGKGGDCKECKERNGHKNKTV